MCIESPQPDIFMFKMHGLKGVKQCFARCQSSLSPFNSIQSNFQYRKPQIFQLILEKIDAKAAQIAK